MARRAHPTPRLDPDIARLAGVLADPSRIAMLDALLDGNAHAIGALARHAGVTAATASGHLRRLVDEQLVLVTDHGPERRVRLARPAAPPPPALARRPPSPPPAAASGAFASPAPPSPSSSSRSPASPSRPRRPPPPPAPP